MIYLEKSIGQQPPIFWKVLADQCQGEGEMMNTLLIEDMVKARQRELLREAECRRQVSLTRGNKSNYIATIRKLVNYVGKMTTTLANSAGRYLRHHIRLAMR